jgi:hypothetical protein
VWSKIISKIKNFLNKPIVRIIAIIIVITAIIIALWSLFGSFFMGYKIVSTKDNTIYVYLPKNKVNEARVANVVKKAQKIAKTEDKQWLIQYQSVNGKTLAPTPPLIMLVAYDDMKTINDLVNPTPAIPVDLSKLSADAKRAAAQKDMQAKQKISETRLAHLVFQANDHNEWQISYGINYQNLKLP